MNQHIMLEKFSTFCNIHWLVWELLQRMNDQEQSKNWNKKDKLGIC